MLKIRLQIYFQNGELYKELLFLPETIGLDEDVGQDYPDRAKKAMGKWIERYPMLIRLPDGFSVWHREYDIYGHVIHEQYLDERGRFCLERADLIVYSHGDYMSLGKKLGSFGYSVRKKPASKKR